METASRSGNTRSLIPEATKQAIREAVLSKKWTSNGAMLGSFHKALEQHGFQPPELADLFETFGDSLEQLEMTKVRVEGKDLFSILENPIYSSMLTAASAENPVEQVSGFKTGGDQLEATEKAWRVPYVGSTARLLRKAMDQMNTERGLDDYANFLPIIQSSGMGKSRAVDEVARQVFTLPFNLRPSEDDTGYPNGDPEIREWLSSSTLSVSQVRIRHRIFFEHLFEEVSRELETWPVYGSQEALAENFRAWLLLNRGTLYARVYAKCVGIKNEAQSPMEHTHDPPAATLTPTPVPIPTVRPVRPKSAHLSGSNRTEELHFVPMSKSKSDSESSPEWQAARSLIALIQRKSGVPPGEELTQRTDDKTPRSVWLHIYFDEAHSLTSTSPLAEGGQTRTCYQILCSVINRFRALDLFVVFLSTNLKISTYSPPQHFWWSSRIRDGTIPGVQAPFCELTFDQWHNDQPLLSEGEHTLEDVCKLGFMVRFGRPLFWTRYESGDGGIKTNIVSFARMKLAGKHNDQLDKDGRLAVLGVRIGLSFDRSRAEARQMEDRLVEGHMRVAFSIPKHREYIYAEALSEPILAEAAAQLMHLGKMWKEPLDVLSDSGSSGLIGKGERGELLARLLLTKAHDYALSQRLKTLPKFTQPILLPDFLEALVGTKNKDEILNAKPNNMPDGPTLADSILGKARLNFTHWAKAADSSVVTDEAAWIALARCFAWQCFDNQPEIDLVTPLMLPSECDKLERYTVSAIFWQIKNRKRTPRVDIDAERLGFFSPYSVDQKSPSPVTAGFADSRPYLTVVLNLGVEVAVPEPAKPETANSQVAGTGTNPSLTVSPAKRMSSRKGKPVHPRYSISILGCSHTTFPPLIAASEEHHYSSLLSPGNSAAEHARDDQEFQEALAQMKPAWKKDEGKMGSYSQFTRREPSRLGTAPPPDRSSQAIEIHEYVPDAKSDGEQAENRFEDGMEVDQDQGVDEDRGSVVEAERLGHERATKVSSSKDGPKAGGTKRSRKTRNKQGDPSGSAKKPK
ncbi:hypothetical protein FRC08_016827 [Ceratobasidium sp. 394]|nr:hypothetical protein FRC08_016827 [Ceratobasidium sp. 394]